MKANTTEEAEWKVLDISLDDYKQICIGNNTTGKVVCHFNTLDLEYEYLLSLANNICEHLNTIK